MKNRLASIPHKKKKGKKQTRNRKGVSRIGGKKTEVLAACTAIGERLNSRAVGGQGEKKDGG